MTSHEAAGPSMQRLSLTLSPLPLGLPCVDTACLLTTPTDSSTLVAISHMSTISIQRITPEGAWENSGREIDNPFRDQVRRRLLYRLGLLTPIPHPTPHHFTLPPQASMVHHLSPLGVGPSLHYHFVAWSAHGDAVALTATPTDLTHHRRTSTPRPTPRVPALHGPRYSPLPCRLASGASLLAASIHHGTIELVHWRAADLDLIPLSLPDEEAPRIDSKVATPMTTMWVPWPFEEPRSRDQRDLASDREPRSTWVRDLVFLKGEVNELGHALLVVMHEEIHPSIVHAVTHLTCMALEEQNDPPRDQMSGSYSASPAVTLQRGPWAVKNIHPSTSMLVPTGKGLLVGDTEAVTLLGFDGAKIWRSLHPTTMMKATITVTPWALWPRVDSSTCWCVTTTTEEDDQKAQSRSRTTKETSSLVRMDVIQLTDGQRSLVDEKNTEVDFAGALSFWLPWTRTSVAYPVPVWDEKKARSGNRLGRDGVRTPSTLGWSPTPTPLSPSLSSPAITYTPGRVLGCWVDHRGDCHILRTTPEGGHQTCSRRRPAHLVVPPRRPTIAVSVAPGGLVLGGAGVPEEGHLVRMEPGGAVQPATQKRNGHIYPTIQTHPGVQVYPVLGCYLPNLTDDSAVVDLGCACLLISDPHGTVLLRYDGGDSGSWRQEDVTVEGARAPTLTAVGIPIAADCIDPIEPASSSSTSSPLLPSRFTQAVQVTARGAYLWTLPHPADAVPTTSTTATQTPAPTLLYELPLARDDVVHCGDVFLVSPSSMVVVWGVGRRVVRVVVEIAIANLGGARVLTTQSSPDLSGEVTAISIVGDAGHVVIATRTRSTSTSTSTYTLTSTLATTIPSFALHLVRSPEGESSSSLLVSDLSLPPGLRRAHALAGCGDGGLLVGGPAGEVWGSSFVPFDGSLLHGWRRVVATGTTLGNGPVRWSPAGGSDHKGRLAITDTGACWIRWLPSSENMYESTPVWAPPPFTTLLGALPFPGGTQTSCHPWAGWDSTGTIRVCTVDTRTRLRIACTSTTKTPTTDSTSFTRSPSMSSWSGVPSVGCRVPGREGVADLLACAVVYPGRVSGLEVRDAVSLRLAGSMDLELGHEVLAMTTVRVSRRQEKNRKTLSSPRSTLGPGNGDHEGDGEVDSHPDADDILLAVSSVLGEPGEEGTESRQCLPSDQCPTTIDYRLSPEVWRRTAMISFFQLSRRPRVGRGVDVVSLRLVGVVPIPSPGLALTQIAVTESSVRSSSDLEYDNSEGLSTSTSGDKTVDANVSHQGGDALSDRTWLALSVTDAVLLMEVKCDLHLQQARATVARAEKRFREAAAEVAAIQGHGLSPEDVWDRAWTDLKAVASGIHEGDESDEGEDEEAGEKAPRGRPSSCVTTKSRLRSSQPPALEAGDGGGGGPGSFWSLRAHAHVVSRHPVSHGCGPMLHVCPGNRPGTLLAAGPLSPWRSYRVVTAQGSPDPFLILTGEGARPATCLYSYPSPEGAEATSVPDFTKMHRTKTETRENMYNLKTMAWMNVVVAELDGGLSLVQVNNAAEDDVAWRAGQWLTAALTAGIESRVRDDTSVAGLAYIAEGPNRNLPLAPHPTIYETEGEPRRVVDLRGGGVGGGGLGRVGPWYP